MNRRGFLVTLAGLAAAVVAPFAAAKQLTLADHLVNWKVMLKPAVLNDAWVCILHPSEERDLRQMAARSEWQAAWTHARKIGIANKATPQHVLRVFREHDPFVAARFGRVEGVRYITSRKL